MNIGKSFLLKTMTSINNKFLEINYSLFEIMLFISIWTYALFGAFISRSENLLLLALSSIITLTISYVFLILDHQNEKKTIKITYTDIKNTVIIFFLMCFLINDGLFSWFYNDQSAHVSEAFKHGIFAAKILPSINEIPYKTFIYITNLLIIIFFIIFFKILRNLNSIYYKIIFFTVIFLSLRIGIILGGGTESMHPPFRLFPIFLSGTLFGLNELGLRLIQIVLVSSFLSHLCAKINSQISKSNTYLFIITIMTTPLFLFTSFTIEPSIFSFMITALFLFDLYEKKNYDELNFSKWLLIISIGSLIRQSIFLLFIPLFLMYLMKKNRDIINPLQTLSPLLLSIPIFFLSLIKGTPSTKNVDSSNLFDNRTLEILINNLNEIFILLIFVSFIPSLKNFKNNIIVFFTFIILLSAFTIVPFYGYDFAYRYHAEYALPFIFLGLFRVVLFLEKKTNKGIVTLVLLLTILFNLRDYNQIFISPKEVNFKTLLANDLSNNAEVYNYLKSENKIDNFYYIGTNQRLISKIIYNLPILSSHNSTKYSHNNIGTFGTGLSFKEIDEIISEYDVIILDIFSLDNNKSLKKNITNERNSLANEITDHKKIAEYLYSKDLEIKKIIKGKLKFETLIFIK